MLVTIPPLFALPILIKSERFQVKSRRTSQQSHNQSLVVQVILVRHQTEGKRFELLTWMEDDQVNHQTSWSLLLLIGCLCWSPIFHNLDGRNIKDSNVLRMFKIILTACFGAVLHEADVSHAGCLKSSLYVVSDGLQSDREACPYCAQYAVTLAHICTSQYAHHNMHHTLTGTYMHITCMGTHGLYGI